LHFFIAIKNLFCKICNEQFETSIGLEDHLPQVICKNNHFFCRQCCSSIQSCPTCKTQKLFQPEKDIEKIKKIKEEKKLVNIPDIPIEQIQRQSVAPSGTL
jgi:hypothetical protein